MPFVNSNSDSLWRLSFLSIPSEDEEEYRNFINPLWILLLLWWNNWRENWKIIYKYKNKITYILFRIVWFFFLKIYFRIELLFHSVYPLNFFFFFYTFDYYCLLFDCAIRKTKVKYQVFTMKFRNILKKYCNKIDP